MFAKQQRNRISHALLVVIEKNTAALKNGTTVCYTHATGHDSVIKKENMTYAHHNFDGSQEDYAE